MQDEVTLSKLPSTATWQFSSSDFAILCDEGKPVSIEVQGAVKKADIFRVAGADVPKLQIWLWSTSDSTHAARLFGSTDNGESDCA